jgi:hypothetical protein
LKGNLHPLTTRVLITAGYRHDSVSWSLRAFGWPTSAVTHALPNSLAGYLHIRRKLYEWGTFALDSLLLCPSILGSRAIVDHERVRLQRVKYYYGKTGNLYCRRAGLRQLKGI